MDDFENCSFAVKFFKSNQQHYFLGEYSSQGFSLSHKVVQVFVNLFGLLFYCIPEKQG